MKEDPEPPQINISKIAVGGGIAGAFFAAACMLIFLIGVPLVRYMFAGAIVVGVAVAMILHFTHHERVSTSRLLTDTKK